MKIVITHISPDFDAIASAYAALLLNKCDHIAMISSFEPNVYEFLKSAGNPLPIKRYNMKEIEDIGEIEHLIITDCKQKKRLGAFAQFIDKAKRVTVYDHHPIYAKDIEPTDEVVKDIGSSTTILVRILQEKKFKLRVFDATLMALGIYEDTGLLTFKSTKPDDALAVAYLLSFSPDTSAIGDYIKRDLNRTQVFILNELLLNLSMVTVGGTDIALSYASTEDYVDEVAYITQRLMMMEGLESLFIMLSTGGRIVLVGRSKTSKVDVSSVVSHFGGGGHATAASAIIKDLLLPEALERLKFYIRDSLRPVKSVSDIMNSPVKYVSSGTMFSKALDITMKYNLNNMPVISKGKTIGIITRKDILHGMKHGLDKEPVNDIMQVEFETVRPDTPFYTAEEIMVTRGQKLLPVEDDKAIVGVITRTDLLRLMHEEITLRSSQAEKARTDLGVSRSRNVRQVMAELLPAGIIKILTDIGLLAEKNSLQAYVVGGFVRDLLMRRQNFDIDIVVEGDAPMLALEYCRMMNGRVAVHSKFKTAKVSLPDGFDIDFATARTEYYMTPAAAPEVEEASIKNDLFRRDFTINAMAIRLDGSQYGQLLDFFSGQKDINEKKIRALHSLSFVDDPSRAFRAIRFAVRFGFDIGNHTERLIKHAESLNLFGQMMGGRLFLELRYILDESGYMKALEMMSGYKLLRFFSDKLSLDRNMSEKLQKLEGIINWYQIQLSSRPVLWRARFGVLFGYLNFEEIKEMTDKFELSSKLKTELLSEDYAEVQNALHLFKRFKTPKPSFIVSVCSKLSIEGLLILATFLNDNMQEVVKSYLTTYKNIAPILKGDDLIKLGVPRDARFKAILDLLKVSKLDGLAPTVDDEIGIVKRYLEKEEMK